MNDASVSQPACRVDHLVVAALDLEQGARWCRQTLGVEPLPGGRHPLMATHNLLLKLGGDAWPACYLEIIAVDPHAGQGPANGRRRWFGLDDPARREQIARAPCLVHFVARVPDLTQAIQDLMQVGEDVGAAVAASRQTPAGVLSWQISVRDDGTPQHAGGLPTLIEWTGTHPTQAMPDSGVGLLALQACSDRPAALRRAWEAIGLRSVQLADQEDSEPKLRAILQTPLGEVRLDSGAG